MWSSFLVAMRIVARRRPRLPEGTSVARQHQVGSQPESDTAVPGGRCGRRSLAPRILPQQLRPPLPPHAAGATSLPPLHDTPRPSRTRSHDASPSGLPQNR